MRARVLPPALRKAPVPSEGEPHVTIAPADPVSATALVDQDGPGTALLRTLTALTADLPDADPGRVAAAALRGRSARADESELRELATEAAAASSPRTRRTAGWPPGC